MTSKSRKSLSSPAWVKCDICQSTILQNVLSDHKSECPPPEFNWNHNFIRNYTLHSTVESITPLELPKSITERDTDNMVFLSQSTLENCQIAVGDRVIITYNNGAICKTAWPMTDKKLTSVCLTKNTLDIYKINGQIKAKKLNLTLNYAKEIVIEPTTNKSPKQKMTQELQVMIRTLNERKVFKVNNFMAVSYFGRNLIFKITKITGEKISVPNNIEAEFEKISIDENQGIFYESLYNTKWTLAAGKENKSDKKIKSAFRLEDIGGYEQLVQKIRNRMTPALVKYKKNYKGFNVCRGILLYGTGGVGKTTIATALLAHYDVNVFKVDNNILSKIVGETESKIRKIFNEARSQGPSVIFIENIDKFCPKKSGSGTETLNTLIDEMDDLYNSNCLTLVLATSSKPDLIDPELRHVGRIEEEFEIPAPTPKIRREILKKLLLNVPNDITEDGIDELSLATHGFVANDLYMLCKKAESQAAEKYGIYENNLTNHEVEFKVSGDDFKSAREQVDPSAMKEILVEVVNVKWSDIGGGDELKLKLKESVEWPITHPEMFSRLGIKPPKGLLMFGPPGCSKTMIAKALATETKVNFINVKGPELFSKWVGDSEKNVRELFRKARQVAPSIIFIDEIDAIGGARSSGGSDTGGSRVQESVLTQFLTELDGVTALENVTLVAATNRPDKLDKALIRAGRFDRKVYVPLPDDKTRLEIFKIIFRKMSIGDDVDIAELVHRTEGFSGAEIQNICNEAGLRALRRNFNTLAIMKDDFDAALIDILPDTPDSLLSIYETYMSKNKNIKQ